jgi:hypothetical protein
MGSSARAATPEELDVRSAALILYLDTWRTLGACMHEHGRGCRAVEFYSSPLY